VCMHMHSRNASYSPSGAMKNSDKNIAMMIFRVLPQDMYQETGKSKSSSLNATPKTPDNACTLRST